MALPNGSSVSDFAAGASARLERAAIVARRAGQVPAYADRFAEAGLQAGAISADSWRDVPLLSKEDLIEGAHAAPPFGGRLAVPRQALAHVFVAPGPLFMPFTAQDLDHVAGSFAAAFSACGLAAGDLVDQTTMYNWVIAATVIDRALGKLGCAVVPGGIGQSERHLEVIRQLRVDALVAFPTFLEHLLDLASESGQPLQLKKAVVMGELSRPDAKRQIRAKHGVVVREFYGVADVGAVAWECEACEGMHLREDVLVEFIAPGGTAAVTPSADAPAEIVVTDFYREAMPIVRLRTGDLVDNVVTAPCACGRTSPRISRIVGRASEITKVKGMFVVPRQVQDVLRRNGVDRAFRLVVDRAEGGRDEITLEVEGDELAERDRIRGEVENALRMRVQLKAAAALPADGPRLVDRRQVGP